LHANKEAVLVDDKKAEDILAQAVLLRRHVVLWVIQNSRLENGRQILRRHFIHVRLARKHSEQIQDIQQ
jgi:hypothetical protein